MEQPRARPVQAREARHPCHRLVQQVLLRGGRGGRAGEGVFQGRQQAPEPAALGAVRASPRGPARHGDQPRLPHAQRRDVHVRAAQARPERVLRQALAVAGRHPHGADRVPPTGRRLADPPAGRPTEHGPPMAIPANHGSWPKRLCDLVPDKGIPSQQRLCLSSRTEELFHSLSNVVVSSYRGIATNA